jgi:hypothetical protein
MDKSGLFLQLRVNGHVLRFFEVLPLLVGDTTAKGYIYGICILHSTRIPPRIVFLKDKKKSAKKLCFGDYHDSISLQKSNTDYIYRTASHEVLIF